SPAPALTHKGTWGCRGLPAGGLAVSPNIPVPLSRGVQGSPCRGFVVSPNYTYPLIKGCSGLPAGGLGVSPNLSLHPKQGVQGSPCRGFGGVPQLSPSLAKRSAITYLRTNTKYTITSARVEATTGPQGNSWRKPPALARRSERRSRP